MTRTVTIGCLCAIFLLGIFFRFYHLQDTPPGIYSDEAMNGSNALEVLETGRASVFYPDNNGREGLFINLQALAIRSFGNDPWALRLVSAIAGSLTILGIFFLSRELFLRSPVMMGRPIDPALTALFASFFLATSYWHINFSRIGFRAILVPLVFSFGCYWLLKAMRTGALTSILLAGVLMGVGFYTYLAWRIVPAILLVLAGMYLWRWKKGLISHCAPCVVGLVMFGMLVTLIPLGSYFFSHPRDISGRQQEVSVFSANQPAYEFLKSTALTLGMFNVHGDCNARHNFQCAPELYWPVGIMFLLGLALLLRDGFRAKTENRMADWFLLSSFLFLMLPATLTREGLPHALRSIGLIVPAMIIAALGAAWLWTRIRQMLDSAIARPAYAEKRGQLMRIKRELFILAIVFFMLVPLNSFTTYFTRFAESADTYDAFAADLTHAGIYLRTIIGSAPVYIIANAGGDDVRGTPISAQPVMFLTDSFITQRRQEKNMHYVTEQTLSSIPTASPVIIVPLRFTPAIQAFMKKTFPHARAEIPGDFILFQT